MQLLQPLLPVSSEDAQVPFACGVYMFEGDKIVIKPLESVAAVMVPKVHTMLATWNKDTKANSD